MKLFGTKLGTLLMAAATLVGSGFASGGGGTRVASGHIPAKAVRRARHLGRHDGQATLGFAVSLNFRQPEALEELLHGLYDPADPRYHQFLTPAEFRARFAPADEDVALVTSYFRSRGLKVASVSGNNMLVNLQGRAADVESTFQLELHDYLTPEGRRAYAPLTDPVLTGAAGDRIAGVHGLDSFTVLKPNLHGRLAPNGVLPRSNTNYLTPTLFRTAFGTSGLSETGTGETLALVEFDGYTATDITQYATEFSNTAPTLQNVYVSDGSTTPTGAPLTTNGASEVTLDIDMAAGMAPGLSKIMVYEAPNSEQGLLNLYTQIATDNTAKVVSASWGIPEDQISNANVTAEAAIFTTLATQGQSVFVATGDYGAYADTGFPTTLFVQDPSSQAKVTAVGGTSLTYNTTSGAYISETSWSDKTQTPNTGGTGGISEFTPLPTWQANLSTALNLGSNTMRMVPDVSLDADPNSGYAIYVTPPAGSGAWYIYGGTSAAAPLWAAFMSIVNQGRVANSLTRIGFANPSIYQVAASSLYSTTFHDIADTSTNLHYPAVAGYDLSTGWGTMKGAALFNALTSSVQPAPAPTSPVLVPAASSVTINWSAASGATSYKVYRSATGATGTYLLIATGDTNTTYTDTTSIGQSYYYITSVNSAGESGASAAVFGVSSQAVPSAPVGLYFSGGQ